MEPQVRSPACSACEAPASGADYCYDRRNFAPPCTKLAIWRPSPSYYEVPRSSGPPLSGTTYFCSPLSGAPVSEAPYSLRMSALRTSAPLPVQGRAPTRRNASLSPPLRCEASHSTSSESPAPHYEPPLHAVLRSVRYSARLVLFTALRSLLLHAELRSTKCRTPSCGEIKGAPALLEPGSL